MLLRSRPDTVHRFPLHKTQTSTSLTKCCPTVKQPQIGITPAVADCRFRAPLSPRLRGTFTILIFAADVKCGRPPPHAYAYTIFQGSMFHKPGTLRPPALAYAYTIFQGSMFHKPGTLRPPALNECKPQAQHEFSVRCVAKVAEACLRWNILPLRKRACVGTYSPCGSVPALKHTSPAAAHSVTATASISTRAPFGIAAT